MQKIKYFETEINYITDSKLKDDLVFLINKLPNYFFEIPASSTGKYHPEYTTGKMGLLKHTKSAVKIAKTLLDNQTIGRKYTAKEKDLILIALILHDGLKKGIIEEKYTIFEHPLLMSKLIMENKNNLNMSITDIRILCKIIESHMGEWNVNPYTKKETLPKPITKLGEFVHMCDFLASRKFLNVFFDNDINIIE